MEDGTEKKNRKNNLSLNPGHYLHKDKSQYANFAVFFFVSVKQKYTGTLC